MVRGQGPVRKERKQQPSNRIEEGNNVRVHSRGLGMARGYLCSIHCRLLSSLSNPAGIGSSLAPPPPPPPAGWLGGYNTQCFLPWIASENPGPCTCHCTPLPTFPIPKLSATSSLVQVVQGGSSYRSRRGFHSVERTDVRFDTRRNR